MSSSNAQKAKEIINKIPVLAVATFSIKRKPWVTPVEAAHDENYNFFWIAAKSAKHSENIRANNEVAMVIFDSSQNAPAAEQVFMEALVFELESEQDIAAALACLQAESHQPMRDVFDFVDNSRMRVYKSVPQKVCLSSDGGLVEVNLFS